MPGPAKPQGREARVQALRVFGQLDLAVDERERLRQLARQAEDELVAVQMASLDPQTLLPNRHGFQALAALGLQACAQLGRPATLLYFELEDGAPLDGGFGPSAEARALKTFADVLRIAFRESDVIGRLAEQGFGVLLVGSDAVRIATVVQRLEVILSQHSAALRLADGIGFRVKQREFELASSSTIASLLATVENEP